MGSRSAGSSGRSRSPRRARVQAKKEPTEVFVAESEHDCTPTDADSRSPSARDRSRSPYEVEPASRVKYEVETNSAATRTWWGKDMSGGNCLYIDANSIPQEFGKVAMRACNATFWMGCSKWLQDGEDLEVFQHFRESCALPSAAGTYEGLRAGAEGGNHKDRLRALAIGLLVSAALHGKLAHEALKNCHELLPSFVAELRDKLQKGQTSKNATATSCRSLQLKRENLKVFSKQASVANVASSRNHERRRDLRSTRPGGDDLGLDNIKAACRDAERAADRIAGEINYKQRQLRAVLVKKDAEEELAKLEDKLASLQRQRAVARTRSRSPIRRQRRWIRGR